MQLQKSDGWLFLFKGEYFFYCRQDFGHFWHYFFFGESRTMIDTIYIGISGNLLLSALKNPARQYLAMVYIGNSEA